MSETDLNEDVLARAESTATNSLDTEVVPLFCLRVGDALLAVDVGFVTSVVEAQPTTPIPRAPPRLKGFAVIADRAVVIVDLAAMFSLPRSGDPTDRRFVLVKGTSMTAALDCDRAFGVTRVRKSGWRPPSAFPEQMRATLSAECDTERGAVGVLDLDRLLDAASLPGPR